MTNKHRLKRLDWAKKNVDTNWNLVIFSDETQIIKGPQGKYRWVDTNEEDYDYNVKHPVKINIWAGIKQNGPNRIHFIEGNLTGEQYIEILNANVLDLIFNDPHLIYQDDNDPKHRCGIVTEWKKAYSINSLEWPPNSPDLNPIENVWNLLKHKLRGKEYETIDDFRNDIIQEWNKLDKSIINNIIYSMPTRVQLVIEKNGNRIDY